MLLEEYNEHIDNGLLALSYYPDDPRQVFVQ